jgi:alkanesulfonate monooxygenase SsuD/methylene tetrahydromethanopterin reductase-like flavin-dependent oxidoreductase (luciferase family)
VRRLNHSGAWFRSRGPFTVPRSPQGRPVIIQAGQSGRGQAFAARWGELVFALYANLEAGKKIYRGFNEQVLKAGRNPANVRMAPAIYVVTGETKAIAEAKMEVIDKLAKPVDALALLSEVLNFDFAAKGMDEAFTDEELRSISGLQAYRDRVVMLSGKKNPTVRDFVAFSNRGTVREFPSFVGSAKEVADQLEHWFHEACDGFVVAGTHLPGSYEDFTRLVVPELQRRRLHRREYAGATLRENLGLPRAAIGDWQLGG